MQLSAGIRYAWVCALALILHIDSIQAQGNVQPDNSARRKIQEHRLLISPTAGIPNDKSFHAGLIYLTGDRYTMNRPGEVEAYAGIFLIERFHVDVDAYIEQSYTIDNRWLHSAEVTYRFGLMADLYKNKFLDIGLGVYLKNFDYTSNILIDMTTVYLIGTYATDKILLNAGVGPSAGYHLAYKRNPFIDFFFGGEYLVADRTSVLLDASVHDAFEYGNILALLGCRYKFRYFVLEGGLAGVTDTDWNRSYLEAFIGTELRV
jgi:hypothetical protein